MTHLEQPALTNRKKRLSVASLPFRIEATIVSLNPEDSMRTDPKMLMRLAELGFLPGERATVMHRGPGGREPIAVQVGDTMFALRSIEAECIEVELPEMEGIKS